MYGATWSDDGTIVFSTTSGVTNQTGRLLKVSDNGGEAEEILASDGDLAFTWPHFLPGGTHLLFSARQVNTLSTGGSIELLSLESGEYRTLIAGAHNAKYSQTGHIIFARGDTVWAVPFDLDTLQITGPESPLFDEVEHNSQLGEAIYDFSDDGLLVYLLGGEAGPSVGEKEAPVWVDRKGNAVAIDLPFENYSDPHISPDGSKAAILIEDDDGIWDVWTVDLQRKTRTRLTFGPNGSFNPIWSLDGEEVIYQSLNDGGGIFSKAANGAGTATLINKNDVATMPKGISPDGKLLLVMDRGGGESDLYVLSVEGESFPQPYITTAFDEGSAELSPNGRFVAYATDESGRNEIQVRTFPDPDEGRWQITADGGSFPKWNPDGSELFYRGFSGSIYVVDVETEPEFSVGEPRLLISADHVTGFGSYAVSADGQRFLMFRSVDSETGETQVNVPQAQLVIVENWFEELKKITPTDESN
jgi:serine/threonine-protein kinase